MTDDVWTGFKVVEGYGQPLKIQRNGIDIALIAAVPDARIIAREFAAAPRALDVLRDILEDMIDYSESSAPRDGCECSTCELARQAQDVLHRAGRPQP